MRGHWHVVGLAAGVLTYTGCRQLVGVVDREEGAAGAAGAAGTGGVASDAGACASCQATKCGKESADCDADAECLQSVACLDACAGDETCRAACIKGFGPLHAELLACRARSCAVACEISCGGIFGTVYPTLAAEGAQCTSCATKQPCKELSACAKIAKCILHAAAVQRSCPLLDRSCWTKVQFDLGDVPESLELHQAVENHCSSECRKGTNWDCVGKFAWPTGKPTEAQFNTRIMKAANPTQPYEGALVRSCMLTDKVCDPGISSDVSDSTGYVSTKVPITNTGFFGYFKLTGKGLLDYLSIMQPPLVGSIYGDETHTPYKVVAAFETLYVEFTKALLKDLPVDESRGYLMPYMADRTATPGRGVTFAVKPKDSQTQVVYFAANALSLEATATDRLGLALIVNVPPATSVQVTAHRADTQEIVGDATLFLLPKTGTNVVMAPRAKQ